MLVLVYKKIILMIKITSVCGNAGSAGIKQGDFLVSVNGHKISDVLDFQFYSMNAMQRLKMLRDGKTYTIKGENLCGELEFDTYLMDKQRSCKNKCDFCFIDQLPPGLRPSLYFKDDDDRLSFLFGNYITLTNITEHDLGRIIKMRISPINISVHTTNPALRVKIMKNPTAGACLRYIRRLAKAGIAVNTQLVLMPGVNDGAELMRSLADLKAWGVQSIACVPVGLTKYRDGLMAITPFTKDTAAAVIDIVKDFGHPAACADEFYLKAKRELPPAEYYGDFPQFENGVGMLALFRQEVSESLQKQAPTAEKRQLSIVTGVAAAPILQEMLDEILKICDNIKVNLYPIENRFFGEHITVAGLLTGGDIIAQLKGKELGDVLLLSEAMLNADKTMMLDDVTPGQLAEELGVKVKFIQADGVSFVSAIINKV